MISPRRDWLVGAGHSIFPDGRHRLAPFIACGREKENLIISSEKKENLNVTL
jgi:hypothetical protein